VADQRVLKTVLEKVYGVRFSHGMLSAAWEWDRYESNILPYVASQYPVSVNGILFAKVNASLTGNWREVEILQLGEHQRIADASSPLSYPVSQKSRVNLEGGYRFQKGRGLDLKLASVRAEYRLYFRQISASAGVELYRRNFSGEKFLYNGVFLRIDRSL
jgi:hypothetical protein